MSAPDTNLEKQKKRHRGPLVGMAIGVVFVVLLIVAYILLTARETPDPELEGTATAPVEETGDSVPATGN